MGEKGIDRIVIPVRLLDFQEHLLYIVYVDRNGDFGFQQRRYGGNGEEGKAGGKNKLPSKGVGMVDPALARRGIPKHEDLDEKEHIDMRGKRGRNGGNESRESTKHRDISRPDGLIRPNEDERSRYEGRFSAKGTKDISRYGEARQDGTKGSGKDLVDGLHRLRLLQQPPAGSQSARSDRKDGGNSRRFQGLGKVAPGASI